MQGIPLDSESRVVQVHYAVVYAPRRSRGRFAEACVTIVFDEQAALEIADAAKHLYAAKVIGPSVSAESQRIYYLDDWL
jgi:hypothetical protein